MTWYETILISLYVATLTMIGATFAAVHFEGTFYLWSLRHDANFVRLWLIYACVFCLSGSLGWIASYGLRWYTPARRIGGLFLVLLTLSVPLFIAPLEIRGQLEALVMSWPGIAVWGVCLIGLVSWLAYQSVRGKPRTVRFALWLLVAVIAMIGIADCFVMHLLLPQMLSADRLVQLAIWSAGAGALAVPLMLALREAHARPVPRSLGFALAFIALTLIVFVYAFPDRQSHLRAANISGVAGRPSVLLIVVDSLRGDFVFRDGHVRETVPNVRALSRDAVLFEDTYSAAPWTAPSFGSILSSAYPSQHRTGERDPNLSFKYPMADSVISLPQVLAGHGYWTGAVLTNPYLKPRFGLDRGFDAYEDLLDIRSYHPVLYGVPIRAVRRWKRRPYLPAQDQTAQIVRMVRRAHASGRPFFVLAHYMDPHIPYSAPNRFRARSDKPPTLVDAYDAEVAHFDYYLGVLLDEIKAMGLYEDLLIVLTSDHGEELFEQRAGAAPGKRLHDHGHTLFEEQLRVPLLIKWPSSEAAGSRRQDPVSLVDLAPTIVSRVGLVVPDAFQGRDISQPAGADSQTSAHAIFAEGLLYGAEQKAAIQGHRKVVLHKLPPSVANSKAYDTASDPMERQGLELSAADPEFQNLCLTLLEFAATRVPGSDNLPIELDPLTIEQLESLGYVN